MFRKTISLAGAAALAVTLGSAVGPANATTSATASSTAACTLDLGSVTAAGAQTARTITAGAPVGVGAMQSVPGVYPAGAVKHLSTFRDLPAPQGGRIRSGLAVMGGALYETSYNLKANGQLDPARPVVNRRIGGGWSNFRWIERSVEQKVSGSVRTTLYAQDTAGTFERWNLESNGGWRDTGGIGGLSTVKSMTLIGRDDLYESFLTNTRAGALMVVVVPVGTYPLETYGRTVRTSTWQVFEQLIATPCGPDGSLVLGIDRDTKSAYLYQFGHVGSTGTVIKSLGKVPGTFNDPHYFRYAPEIDNLTGE
ncbi:hypothetical protein [Kribbella sp. CA-293567]|uniref:hypothetical protein n=1 Tax=Kribbella sp. CA-293567 TaxID=3002436 RepID=UPI0022DE6BA3|nr:hypothetical protein [Kribbella sp. CA-293567]WBQ04327.1 hypothetical protein OX958_30710 [Kribbella sp. CA-293567]